jgi:hypothetical protein
VTSNLGLRFDTLGHALWGSTRAFSRLSRWVARRFPTARLRHDAVAPLFEPRNFFPDESLIAPNPWLEHTGCTNGLLIHDVTTVSLGEA